MPVRTQLWTNGPSKTFKIGNASVSTRHVPPSKLLWHDIPLGRLFRALQALNPETTKPDELLRAFKLLGQFDEEIKVSISTLIKEPSLRRWEPLLKKTLDSIQRNNYHPIQLQ